MGIPYRRCYYIDSSGQQCETWFPAEDENKLCPAHREVISPSNGKNDESKVRYIDLVNDQRKYCYHFLDGSSQNQDLTLIHEFKDDQDGTIFEKLDRHISFLDKVLEDIKARHQATRAVRAEKLDLLTEEQRKELRKHKIERAIEAKPSFKKDPVANLTKRFKGLSEDAAKAMLNMDVDALLEKFNKAKENKDNKSDEDV